MNRNAILYVLLLALLLYLAQTTLNDYYLRILTVVAINIILTVSLNLTNGFTGDFSLGHAAFMSIGAYTAAILTVPVAAKATLMSELPAWLGGVQLPFVVATVIGGLLAALVAIVVGVPVLRLRGHYLAVATLGLMVIVRVIAVQWTEVTRGAKGINGIPAQTNVWWGFGWALITIYVVWRLVNSAYGRGMLAIREDVVAAAARGVNVAYHRRLALAAGAFFAGVGGALWGSLITAITPSSFSFLITFNVLVMLVIGGIGSISGAVVGAIVMTIAPELLRSLETSLTIGGHPLYGLSQVLVSATTIVVMIFRPQGLFGGREIRLPQILRPRQGVGRVEADRVSK